NNALRTIAIQRGRFGSRAIRGELHDRVELRINHGDPIEMQSDELARRHVLVANEPGQPAERAEQEVAVRGRRSDWPRLAQPERGHGQGRHEVATGDRHPPNRSSRYRSAGSLSRKATAGPALASGVTISPFARKS